MTLAAGTLASGLPRWVEVPLAVGGLVVVAPVLGVAALLVKVTSPGPAIFRQQRVGQGGEFFALLKLRSMRSDPRGAAITAGDDTRITSVGRVLRRAKLDELPALWNVLRGDMSFVGPRPEVPRYVDQDDPRWRAVLTARPGITDPVTLRLRDEEGLLASVDGDRDAYYRRYLVPFKLAGYRDYLDRRTAWTDLAVILRTVLGVARIGRVAPPTRQEVEAAAVASEAPRPLGRTVRRPLER